MGEKTEISWCDATFNPWMGCTKVSQACQNCYAERDMDHRYGKVQWGPSGTRSKTSDANWRKPLKWNRDAEKAGIRVSVFCASLADVFEDWQGPILDHNRQQLFHVINGIKPSQSKSISKRWEAQGCTPITMDDLRCDLFALIDATPNLDWLVLTKRPENVKKMWPAKFDGPTKVDLLGPMPDLSRGVPWSDGNRNNDQRSNIVLGTSIENQEWADRRLPYLHAAKRYGLVNRTFVSAEPLVGPIMLQGELDGKVYNHLGEGGIDWVVTGGESGPNARPCDPEWFRSLRDQCAASGTPFHFKQYGEFNEHQDRVGKKNAGRLLDGREHNSSANAVYV